MENESKKGKKSGAKRKAPGKDARPSKTSFVLGLPADLSASEVVAKAREAGIELTEKYVYNVRSARRTKGGGEAPKKRTGKAKASAPARKGAPRAPAPVGRSAIENRFVDTALDLGLARAASLLDELRAKVKGLVLR
jgi:hypothetical protein